MNVFFLVDKNFIYCEFIELLKVRLYIPMIEITVFSNQGLNKSLEWSLHLEDGKEKGPISFPLLFSIHLLKALLVYVSRT